MAKVLATSKEFNDYIENGVSVIDFFATWCGPCKMLAPVFDEVSSEMDNAKFAKVDIDQNLEIAREFNVTTVPTMIIFKDGKKIDSMVGFMPKEKIIEKVKQYV